MRRSEDKNKTVQKATLRCWKAVFSIGGKRPQMRNIAIFLGLQAHSEIVTVETQLILPTVFPGQMKENGLIRCLRNHVKPRSVVFLDPTLSGYLVPWDVFYLSGIGIHSIVRRLIIAVTVITVSGRAGSCSLVKPLRTRQAGWRRRRLRHVDWPLSGCLPLFCLL